MSHVPVNGAEGPETPVLYAFGGLPGTGKSTLARLLARETEATYLRADTIEDTMRVAGITLTGPEGYLVAYSVAADNLRLGRSVIADCVNPIAATRDAWRNVATSCDARLVEIEIVCTDQEEHRRRIEARVPDVGGFTAASWEMVVNREYEPWPDSRLVVDTAGSDIARSMELLRDRLGI